MPAFGLPVPNTPRPPPPMAPPGMGASPMGAPGAVPPAPMGPPPTTMNFGGLMTVQNQAAVLKQANDAAFEQQQQQPVISGLAGHITQAFSDAVQGKLDVERQMLEALLAKRGQYTPEKEAEIKQTGQPLIYMMLAAGKMRQMESLLRDVFLGSGSDKPWTVRPTPVPELPPAESQQVVMALEMELQQAMMAGLFPTMEQAQERIREMKDQVLSQIYQLALEKAKRMEDKMEDQLIQGNWLNAFDEFLIDLTTFKTAFMQGPIIRKRMRMSWDPNGQIVTNEENVLEFDRVDPFMLYPAKWARTIDDGPLCHRHRLTREDLNSMIGVEGYSEPAIRKVLEMYGDSGLNKSWLGIDTEKAHAEGKTYDSIQGTGLIDAIQYWGSASGSMLLEWGMDDTQVPDPTKEYDIEAWKVGEIVIKAVLNQDPLGRRNYYAASPQRVPGSVWGVSIFDMMRDCQDVCNAAARALCANMGISSGPQVAMITDRLPGGEEVTTMYPWKIWQFTSDPMGSTAQPIQFFQPTSNAQELMAIYEKFSFLADEYTGIPRYMAGAEGSSVSRTASGLSMMIGNASKLIKQVATGIDLNVLTKMLRRLYFYNMRYLDDPDLKGDVDIVPGGALALQVKEAAQVRLNEFLQATLNPVDMQIIGNEGRAELLREQVKNLNVNTDRVIPPVSVIRQRAAQQAMAMMQQQGPPGSKGQPQGTPGPGGDNSGQALMNGAPTSDHFSPKPQAS